MAMAVEEKQNELSMLDKAIGYKDSCYIVYPGRAKNGMGMSSLKILTYLWMTPETIEEIKNWGQDE